MQAACLQQLQLIGEGQPTFKGPQTGSSSWSKLLSMAAFFPKRSGFKVKPRVRCSRSTPVAHWRAARRPDGVNPVADRNDGVEVVVIDQIGLAIGGSCCIFCNNCLALQLPGRKDVFQMARERRLLVAKQVPQLR